MATPAIESGQHTVSVSAGRGGCNIAAGVVVCICVAVGVCERAEVGLGAHCAVWSSGSL